MTTIALTICIVQERLPRSITQLSLFSFQPHHGQPIGKLAHLQRVVLQLSIDGIQVCPNTNLFGRLEAACIDERRHGRPHALHVVKEKIRGQVTQSLDFLDQVPSLVAVVVGFLQEII